MLQKFYVINLLSGILFFGTLYSSDEWASISKFEGLPNYANLLRAKFEDRAAFTPFYMAASCGYRDIFEKIVSSGDFTKDSKSAEQALFVSVLRKHADMSCRLLDLGVDPEPSFALSTAAGNGDIDFVRLLLRKYKVSLASADGREALRSAVISGYREVTEELLDSGADVNAASEDDGCSPLHGVYDICVAKLLIDRGADINCRNKKGETPFDRQDRVDVAEFLFSVGGRSANIAELIGGLTESDNANMVEFLLSKGYPGNLCFGGRELTPLAMCIMKCKSQHLVSESRKRILKLLIPITDLKLAMHDVIDTTIGEELEELFKRYPESRV